MTLSSDFENMNDEACKIIQSYMINDEYDAILEDDSNIDTQIFNAAVDCLSTEFSIEERRKAGEKMRELVRNRGNDTENLI